MVYEVELNTANGKMDFKNFLIKSVDYEYIRGRICLNISTRNTEKEFTEDYLKLIKTVRKDINERGWLNLKVKVITKGKLLREYEIKRGRLEKLFETENIYDSHGNFKLIIKEAMFNENTDYEEQEKYSIRIIPDEFTDMLLNEINFQYDQIEYEELKKIINTVKRKEERLSCYFEIKDEEKSITGKVLINLSKIEKIKYESRIFGENMSNHIKLGLKKIYKEILLKNKIDRIFLNGMYISCNIKEKIDMTKIELKAKKISKKKKEKTIEEEISELEEKKPILLKGNEVIKDKKKSELKANTEYESNGYYYKTDELGRIKEVKGKLNMDFIENEYTKQGKKKIKVSERNESHQKLAGGADRLSNDHGGHLIASIFGGSGELDNLVAMGGNTVNLSSFKLLENTWKEALTSDPPQKVYVKIEPIYIGNSKRPDSFNIIYTIDGKKERKKIYNEKGTK